ncbi:hypothetical protein ARMGADRAFT_1082417 [Armillaria gallica]|uniref:Uncharacterized protein n=1 Tax=Armillaria gallica TaxID=47427 RepID=A0A2H3DA63_ARMGA|nr:hypothetical protein ARMGADRAFT_1082417 [Armillaria gallica]
MSQEEQEISQGGMDEMKWVEANNLSREDWPSWVRPPAQRLSEAKVDEQEDISVKEKPAKRKRKKTKKKSKEIVIDDDELETDLKPVGASGSNLFKCHKPPPFRLSKSELLAYPQIGADDEDSTWRNGFLQVNCTKGPVMGAICRPAQAEQSLHLWSLPTSSDRPSTPPPDPHLTERCNSPICIDVFSVSENSWVKFEIDCLKASDPFEREILELLLACQTDTLGQNPAWLDRTDAPSRVVHLQYSDTINILPLFRQQSVELGDLDTPIQVHEPVQRVMDASPRSAMPTVEITSTLQTVLNEGSKGQVLNALTLPMPDTTLQSPLFHQAASHLEACKVTRSIGSDLLAAPFPAAALSWGLASVAGAVTPPHSNFGGSAVKIHTLVGRKIWCVISKRQEDERGKTWDTFVQDFQVVMSLQALYAQNSWIYPFITQYLRNDTIIILTYSIIPPTLNNTTDFCSIGHKHPDTILKP